ncbi:plastid division protein PDV2-like [Aristolochia californica]|uniref:plastid division protein PDV2-like n=1 Tax=Aristolochia californica TaxID=171875 RepID=UPI0035E0315D
MDVDGIGAVLSRVAVLRSTINNCMDKASSRETDEGSSSFVDRGEAEEEAESLLNIRDALESLEEQIASLQALEQLQRYEKEATITEIEHSRKLLLQKLKEYKGEDLEVIREASAFADATIERDEDLHLPPYPSRLPDLFIMNEAYSSQLHRNKSARNGVPAEIKQKGVDESVKPDHPVQENTPRGLKFTFACAAKTVFTIFGVVTVLKIAGCEPKMRKHSNPFKILELFKKAQAEEKQLRIQCPPGKVLVIDGEPRCIVKERVEVPFEPGIKAPDVSYGFG